MRLSLDTMVVQNKSLDVTDMDGEKVMMNLDKGNYYGLNSVGSRIWELVEEPRPVDEIVSILTKEYSVEPELCEESVLAFLSKLYNSELVCIVG